MRPGRRANDDQARRDLAAIALALPAHAAAADVGRWRAHIAEASARFDVPEEWIVRVMRAESGGHPQAISRAGAMGLISWPGTWAEMRARLGLGPNPFGPRDNILAGTFYLKRMHDRIGYPGLFAAYNAGPERYADYLAGKRGLPLETRAYLASVAGKQHRATAVSHDPDAARSGIFFRLSGEGSKR